jgi:mRNA interferase MazF
VVRRGEVWWVEDPDSGRRPHLILTRETAIPVLNSVLAVPATRTVRGIPTEVAVGSEDGLQEQCVLSLDNLTSMPKPYFVERICELGAIRMQAVCRALGYATACDGP